MRIIPQVKKYEESTGIADLTYLNWSFCDGLDGRVIAAAKRFFPNTSGGVRVRIDSGSGMSEGYTLDITNDGVYIRSGGPAGAFYAIMTLRQLLRDSRRIRCCSITDEPSMEYRGFYHDVSRGKIPNMDTLKALVDRMAELKLNSLQLYIEHTFEFREYEFCRDDLGCLTAEEIRELSEYCTDNFIDLVPSVSLFGHLYHLLQSDRYSHLSELQDYKPTSHYWVERMRHHTINPLDEESFDVVKNLIDQYLGVSDSIWFNICCDETFDLGRGVNAGQDRDRLYIDFVKRITEYLTRKRRRVMMWSDFTWDDPDKIGELPENSVLLSWDYEAEPNEEHISAIDAANRKQIVCPGTSSWSAFSENIRVEEKNITAMAQYGHLYSAIGMLNTNWGDYGNIGSLTMAQYGLLIGAAASWNRRTAVNSYFRKDASELLYGNTELLDLMEDVSWNRGCSNWSRLISGEGETLERKYYEDAVSLCDKTAHRIGELKFNDPTVRREVLSAVDGYALLAKWCALRDGEEIPCYVDFDEWIDEYEKLWRMRNSRDELHEVLRVFRACNEGAAI